VVYKIELRFVPNNCFFKYVINNHLFQWAPPNKSRHINAGAEIMSPSLIPLLSQSGWCYYKNNKV